MIGDDDARAAEDGPAAGAVRVVDGDAGRRVGDRRDVRDRPLRAAGVGLERRLRLVPRAAAPGALGGRRRPHRLRPAARVARRRERGPADGGDVRVGGGELDAVPLVAGRHRDRDAGVLVVLGADGRVARALRSAVAVRDGRCALRDRLVDGGAEIRVGRAGRLDEQDVAQRADRRDHLDVEHDLACPAGIRGGQRARRPVLVDLAEAAVRRRAGRQAELAAVRGQVALRTGIVVGVDDRHRPAGAEARRDVVGAVDAGRPIAAHRRCGALAGRNRREHVRRPMQGETGPLTGWRIGAGADEGSPGRLRRGFQCASPGGCTGEYAER